MGNGSCKLNGAHSLTSYLLGGNLNSALLAHLTLKANSLVLSAKAFPVLSRAKNPLTEKSVALCFQGTVVDGFRLGYLTVRPRTYGFGRGKTYFDRIKRISFHKFFICGRSRDEGAPFPFC